MTRTVRRPGRTDADTTGAWRGFGGAAWRDTVDSRQFLQDNYTPYDGDASCLTGPTAGRRRCGPG